MVSLYRLDRNIIYCHQGAGVAPSWGKIFKEEKVFHELSYISTYVSKEKSNYVVLFLSKKTFNSIANSGRSSVIANHLGVLVGQNRYRFLEITKHN